MGPRFIWGSSHITLRLAKVAGIPVPPDLGLNSTLAALGFLVTRDTRPNRFYPTTGTLLDFTSDFFAHGLGSKYSFQTYKFTFNKYGSLSKNQVLAYNLYSCATGQPPFYGNCIYGTQNELRGYAAGRYLDRYMVATQLEYCLTLPKRFGLVGFGGLGEVIPGGNQPFRTKNFLPSRRRRSQVRVKQEVSRQPSRRRTGHRQPHVEHGGWRSLLTKLAKFHLKCRTVASDRGRFRQGDIKFKRMPSPPRILTHDFFNEEIIVQLVQRPALSGLHNLMAAALLCVFLAFLFVPLVHSQQHDMDSMPGMDMKAPAAPEDPAVTAKRLADRRESEFNHHLAGVLVAVAGMFILAEGGLALRWPLVRYVWPMCFIAAGLFLLVFSDTEIWPFGPQSFWYAITHNREDLQHKTFSVILLALGYVEFQRARGRWKSRWAAWFFPVVGLAGAVLLLFHVHGGDMQAPGAMESMEHIQKQHRWFAGTGFGIALTNGLAGLTGRTRKWQKFLKTAWPVLLIFLGILLTQYSE